MKNILQQMMEESYIDRKRAKNRFIRTITMLLMALIAPLLFGMLLMLFRILVFDSNKFKIEDISYNVAQDPYNIHITAGFTNKSPINVKISDISINFYVSTEPRKYLLLFSVRKDETILQKGKQIAVKDHLLRIVDIKNENALCVFKAKKIKIALKYKLSPRIFGIYLGKHMKGDYIIDLEGKDCKTRKNVDIERIDAVDDTLNIHLKLTGYAMSEFFKVHIPQLTLEAKCCNYLFDMIIDPMSIERGAVQEKLRITLKFYGEHGLCANDIIKKTIKTLDGGSDHLQLMMCRLKDDYGIFNKFFDELHVPVLMFVGDQVAGPANGESAPRNININYDPKEKAVFIKKIGRGNTVLRYLFEALQHLTLDCIIEDEIVAKIEIEQYIKGHILKAKVQLFNLQRIIATILNNGTVYIRTSFPNAVLQGIFKNFFISYSVKDGLRFSFREHIEKSSPDLSIKVSHNISEHPDQNMVLIKSETLSYFTDARAECLINLVGFRFRVQLKTFSVNCFLKLCVFFSSENVFMGISFVSEVEIIVDASHKLVKEKKVLNDSLKHTLVNNKHAINLFELVSGEKKTPWYNQLIDNSRYVVSRVTGRINGTLYKNKYIRTRDFFVMNRIERGGPTVEFTLYDKLDDEIAHIDAVLSNFVICYSKVHGIYIDGLRNSFNFDILGLSAISEYCRVSCTSKSLLSQFIQPFTLFCEFKEKQIIEQDNIIEGKNHANACIHLNTSHGLGIGGILYYAEDNQKTKNTNSPGLRISWPDINIESRCDVSDSFFKLHLQESNVALTSFAQNTRKSLGRPLFLGFLIDYRTSISEEQNMNVNDDANVDAKQIAERKFFLNKFFKKHKTFSIQEFAKFIAKDDNSGSSANDPPSLEINVDENPYKAKIVLKCPNLLRKIGRIWSFHKFLGFATLPSKIAVHLKVKEFKLLHISMRSINMVAVDAAVNQTLIFPIYYTRHDSQVSNPVNESESDHILSLETNISLETAKEPQFFCINDIRSTFEVWSDVLRFLNGERTDLLFRYTKRTELFYIFIQIGFRLTLNLKHDLSIFMGINGNLYFELNIANFCHDNAVFLPVYFSPSGQKRFLFPPSYQPRNNSTYPFSVYVTYGNMLLEANSFSVTPYIGSFVALCEYITAHFVDIWYFLVIKDNDILDQSYDSNTISRMISRCYLSTPGGSVRSLQENTYRSHENTPTNV